MTSSTHQRISYLDIAKGVLILLLLLWHFGDAMKRNGLADTNPYLLPVFIVQPLFYPFFMQAFFILSGYCTKLEIDFKTYLLKNLKTLMLPWLVFESIRLLYCVLTGNYENSVLTRPELTSLWFLNALFWAKMLAWGLHRISRNAWFLLFSSLALLTAGVVLYNLPVRPNILFYQHGLVACFLVLVGYLLKQQDRLYAVLLKYSWVVYLAVLAAWKVFHFDLPFSTAALSVHLCTIPLYLVVSVTGTFTLLLLCKWIKTSRFLEYYGRNTLVMYGTHMIPYEIIMCLLSRYIPLDGWLHGALFIASALVLEAVTCALIIRLFNTKYLRYAIGKF